MNMKRFFAIALVLASVNCAAFAAGAGFKVLFEDKLDSTEGIAVCPDGSMFVGENKTGKIHKIVSDDKLELYHEGATYPAGLACGPDNTLYVLEYKDGNVTALKRGDKGVTATKAATGLRTPNGAIVRSDGTVFISESDTGRIVTISPDGKVSEFTKGIMYANGMVLSGDEKTLFVASTTGNRVYAVALDGEGKGKKKPFAKNTKMVDGMVRDSEGNIYACLFAEGRVVKIDTAGELKLVAEGMKATATPALKDGALYVTNLSGKGIYKIDLKAE